MVTVSNYLGALLETLIASSEEEVLKFSLKGLEIAGPYGHVAQLDRASDSGSEGRGFESLHVRSSRSFQSSSLRTALTIRDSSFFSLEEIRRADPLMMPSRLRNDS